jgi:hypothetical protein
MEYYGYPSLLELWIYGDLSNNIWENIISRIIKIINIFTKHQGAVSKKDYKYMYYEKTKKRIEILKKDNLKWTKLFKYEYIYINGKKFKNWSYIKERLSGLIDDLYNKEHNCILHGDLCFSNILFDLNNGIIRFIDPRGEWGENILYGDIKYDIAKLRHSISGKYDFIVNDLFSIDLKENKLDLSFNMVSSVQNNLSIKFDNMIGKSYNLKKIKLIEGLLFISMLPLHNDTPKRQLAMFAQGIKNLNEIL